MASVSTYLNFDGTCEEAFAFYRQVFGTEYAGRPMKMSEMPAVEGEPGVPPEEADNVLHVALPILGDHLLMGSDISPSRGHVLRHGNDMSVTLNCDALAQLNHLFFALSEDAGETFGPMPMFFGQHYATVQDRFGIRWMLVAPVDPAPSAPSA